MYRINRIALVWLLVILLLSPSAYGFIGSESDLEPETALRSSSVSSDLSASDDVPVEICFIDVGQGDSVLIHTKDHAILIDGGDEEHGSKIISVLHQKGIRHLDMIVATHVHEDHIGGLPEIIKSFTVDKVLSPVASYGSVAFKKLRDSLDTQNGTITVPSAGDNISLGNEMVLEVLGPVRDSEIINNTSLVLRLSIGSFHALFAGDAELEEEQDILKSASDLKSAILKVGHHGSSSSSSEEWLRAIRPGTALISCGSGNQYGYPDKSVLDRFRAMGCEVYRTDHHGTIQIVAHLDGTYGCVPEHYFTDITNGKWYSDSISFCASRGYVSGYSDGTFSPGTAITRGEFAAVMNRVLSLNDTTENTYTDVKPDQWYTIPVLNCVKAGILTGYGNHTIGVGDPLTREQAALILTKAFRLSPRSESTSFTDDRTISHWAKGAVSVMAENGLLTGMPDGSFRPKENLTRAQMCVLIRACLQKQQKTQLSKEIDS